MKKVLSVLLAVICVFSMATVAFAGDLTNKCDVCGFTSNDIDEFTAHKNARACGICSYCNVTAYKNADELAKHKPVCEYAGIVCDYCGKAQASETIFAAHVAECKVTYHNIPLAKIIATVKDLIAKIDFESIIATVKDKVVPAITDFVGGIDLGALGIGK